MNKTPIEYLTHTWNPFAMRCTPVSSGCTHCWHLSMTNRMAKNPKLSAVVRAAYAGESGPVFLESRLDEPIERKKPSVIGVQLMGDLFHVRIKLEWQLSVFRVIEQCPQHTFLVLTKRIDQVRMLHICTGWEPPENVWLGVTAENQKQWDIRVGILKQIPAAVRFVSIEPMLSEINMHMISLSGYKMLSRWYGPDGFDETGSQPEKKQRKIGFVIVGAETGPGARPMDLDWARSIRDQCQAAGVAFFMKKVSKGNIPPDLMIREYPDGI